MLTERDHLTIQLEGVRFKYAGVKETRVRELFGESMTRYCQRVDALIDRPEVLAAYPMTVRRLLRLREARRAVRTGAR